MDNANRAKVLIQAMPYIKKFVGETIVVKYGGNAMLNEELKSAVMSDLVLMQLVGISVVLVHGGGPEINSMLDAVGKESVFKDGMRVTDDETIDICDLVAANRSFGTVETSSQWSPAADLDGSSEIGSYDLALIRAMILGIDKSQWTE